MTQEFQVTRDLHTFQNIDIQIITGDSLKLNLAFTTLPEDALLDNFNKRFSTINNLSAESVLEEEFDLTGSIIKMTVKKNPEDDEEDAVITKSSLNGAQILITDATGGEASVFLVPADTEDLTPGEYFYDIEVSFASTGDAYTPVIGKFELISGVTGVAV